MTESTEQGETQVTTETVEPSLDDIISEYAVKAPTVAQQEARVEQQQYAANMNIGLPSSVDPLDENQFKQFIKSVADGQSALYSQLNEVKAELTKSKQQAAELQVETDIKSAVSVVNDGLNLDPRAVRVHLELLAQEKPGFKQIWENRNSDPTTYKKALNAVKKELSGMYATRQDPGLAETQAAMRQSQRTLASQPERKTSGPIEDQLANAQGADFDRLWDQLSGMG